MTRKELIDQIRRNRLDWFVLRERESVVEKKEKHLFTEKKVHGRELEKEEGCNMNHSIKLINGQDSYPCQKNKTNKKISLKYLAFISFSSFFL